MKTGFLLSLFFLITLNTLAQTFTVSGNITDQNGKPVPFASVYARGTTKGTSANADGNYRLHISAGKYDLVFRAIGYKPESKSIELNADQVMDVTLTTEKYELKGVTVHAGEDPAYAIMRKAIKKRKTYLQEVRAYSCDVYIKGLQRMLKAPKRFLGTDITQIAKELGLDSNRRGIVYLSESESKFTFMQPNKVHEEMVSSKVSGSNQAFSFNRASDLQVNFYQNLQDLGPMSTRPLISPIADNAFFFYDYYWMGITVENGQTINKIKVVPKRMNDPVFTGYIYIVEDSWRIYSVDLAVVKNPNINILDSLGISQQYIPVNAKNWMPSTVNFNFSAALFGFKVAGYFVEVFKNYDLAPSITKNEFAEVMRVPAGINKKDSTYWQQERPIPLTPEEQTDYHKKEKLAEKRESKAYQDSLDHKLNKLNPVKVLITGVNINNRYEHQRWHFSSLLNAVGFNPVEGFFADYDASYIKRTDTVSGRYFSLGGNIRYGFSDRLLHGGLNGNISVGDWNLGFEGGSQMRNLNDRLTLPNAFNTYYSLFEHRNYEKIYQKNYGSLALSGRIAGGWLINFFTEYADRTWLPNTTEYSFFHRERQYTSNNPFVPDQEVPVFPENQSFQVGFTTSYDFSNRYVTYPSGRYYLPSSYPKIELTYTAAIKNVFGSDAQYQKLSADIVKNDINFGLYGKTSFYIGAGTFFNKKDIYYVDYEHFNGNETRAYEAHLNSFLLLPFYNYSTSGNYFEGHLEHNFSGFILNKIPLIRELKWQEIVDVNYLSTKELKNYLELGAGIQYLGFRFMYATTFTNGTRMNGLRVAITVR